MSASCVSVQTSLESFVEKDIKQVAAEWQKKLVHTSNGVSEFSVAHKDKLDHAERTVDRYITQELQQDIPTGIRIEKIEILRTTLCMYSSISERLYVKYNLIINCRYDTSASPVPLSQ